jgi:hypothetical protein
LKELFLEKQDEYGYQVIDMEVMADLRSAWGKIAKIAKNVGVLFWQSVI